MVLKLAHGALRTVRILALMVPAGVGAQPTVEIDPVGAQAAAPAWSAINDAVMGGVSTGAFGRTAGGALVFSGSISFENNGGFASIKRPVECSRCAAGDAFLLRVRGDGKRYKLTAQTEQGPGAPQYQSAFETDAGETQELVLPLAGFHASFRGRPVPDAPPLAADRIVNVGFLISDKQEGPFTLEIYRIALRLR